MFTDFQGVQRQSGGDRIYSNLAPQRVFLSFRCPSLHFFEGGQTKMLQIDRIARISSGQGRLLPLLCSFTRSPLFVGLLRLSLGLARP